jgi:uncharacterized protein GlcG (DUF336 family)
MKHARIPTLICAFLPFCAFAGAQSAPRKTITVEGARAVMAAARAHATRHGSGGTIAIVDDGGHPVLLERLDGTFPASPGIAIGKARTAALFRRPTKAFEELIGKGGRTAMVTVAEVADFVPLQGGVPIVIDGEVVGAIGVSGATSAQVDEDIAQAGALSATVKPGDTGHPAGPRAVSHVESAAVAAAFTRGAPLLEVEEYKVHASRRDGPGMAEVHELDTDIIHVLDGAAVLVTGGEMKDRKELARGELRGSSIEGGEARRLAKGDVIVVPRGTPHWFREVAAPLTYYVVKVSAPATRGVAKS